MAPDNIRLLYDVLIMIMIFYDTHVLYVRIRGLKGRKSLLKIKKNLIEYHGALLLKQP